MAKQQGTKQTKTPASKEAAPKAAAPRALAPKTPAAKGLAPMAEAPKELAPDAPRPSRARATTRKAATPPTQQEIAARAYFRFLERGGHAGFEVEDWLAAEAELTAGPIKK